MILTDSLRSQAKQILYTITAHTVLLILYNYAYEKIDLTHAFTAYLPIIILFCLAPLAAAFFLSTQSAHQGAVIVLGVLPAELIFNILTRFTAPPPFTPQEPAFLWKILYEGSFGFVLILEVAGFWLTFKFLREIHRQKSLPSEKVAKE
jgi:hypothetical protein